MQLQTKQELSIPQCKPELAAFQHKGQEPKVFSVNCITRGENRKILWPVQYARREISAEMEHLLPQFVHCQKEAMESWPVIEELAEK